jgi:hypothetical protein
MEEIKEILWIGFCILVICGGSSWLGYKIGDWFDK